MPVPWVKPAELFSVSPPRKVKAEAVALAVQMPPELIVTAPTKRFVPVAELSFKMPVIEVAPLTVKPRVLSCKVPAVIVKPPLQMTAPANVKVVNALLIVRLL